MKNKEIVQNALFLSLLIVLSQISVPLSYGVPITLQVFGITLISLLTSSKRGFYIVLSYVILGAIGIPVFANFSSGIVRQTSGFIISFPLMPIIINIFKKQNKKYITLLGIFIADTVNFIFGLLIFILFTSINIEKALFIAVIPFIPSTIILSIIALNIYLYINKKIKF